MDLTRQQRQKIQKIGKKYRLKLILLHGSYAKNQARPGSDLDIAILGQKEIDFKTLLQIQQSLADVLGNNPERELDLKSLHRADPLLCYQVAQHSQLLYGNLTDYNEFRAYAFRIYHDMKDLFKLEKQLVEKYQNYLEHKYA